MVGSFHKSSNHSQLLAHLSEFLFQLFFFFFKCLSVYLSVVMGTLVKWPEVQVWK